MGAPLVAIKGYGAPEVEDVYVRARGLCERLGTPPDPPVLRALAIVNLARGELPGAYELGEQLLWIGEREDDPMVRVEGNYVLGVTSFWLGDFGVARDQLERAVAEHLPDRAQSHLALYSQDPRIVCMSRLAYCLRFLADPAQAEEKAREALRLADELEHPFSLAYALHFTAWLAIDLGDEPRARERAERMAALAEEQRLGFLQPMGAILRGWMLAGEGRTEEALTRIREGLGAYVHNGWTLYQPYCLVLLARVCLNAGLLDDGRAAILQAFELTERIGQRYLDADLQLLMGELVLAAGEDRADAESHFTRGARHRPPPSRPATRATRDRAAGAASRPPWLTERPPNGPGTPVRLYPPEREAAEANDREETEVRSIPREEVPVVIADDGLELRVRDEEGLSVGFVRLPAGADLRAATQGLPHDLCPCPHWGYMMSGHVRMHTPEGHMDFVAGQAFYWGPGHAPEALEDSEYVDFSPTEELRRVLDHITGGAARQD